MVQSKWLVQSCQNSQIPLFNAFLKYALRVYLEQIFEWKLCHPIFSRGITPQNYQKLSIICKLTLWKCWHLFFGIWNLLNLIFQYFMKITSSYCLCKLLRKIFKIGVWYRNWSYGIDKANYFKIKINFLGWNYAGNVLESLSRYGLMVTHWSVHKRGWFLCPFSNH